MGVAEPRSFSPHPVRLREAIKFYEGLPDSTRQQLRSVSEHNLPWLHFCFGLHLRNNLLWGRDVVILAREIEELLRCHNNGQKDFDLLKLEKRANSPNNPTRVDVDDISNDLSRILYLREHQKIVVADAH